MKNLYGYLNFQMDLDMTILAIKKNELVRLWQMSSFIKISEGKPYDKKWFFLDALTWTPENVIPLDEHFLMQNPMEFDLLCQYMWFSGNILFSLST